uniref:Uncharacterized protein n=1 Tax=Candidatus Methanophagaceae archaeon ANME-1 ERB6 TaxID=2759912 RepID=A0A7G9YYB6_9EURY|nr:hypothetical protein PNHJDAII_00004 [Methanosarcinales archaeon ANME-1 ERB6]
MEGQEAGANKNPYSLRTGTHRPWQDHLTRQHKGHHNNSKGSGTRDTAYWGNGNPDRADKEDL